MVNNLKVCRIKRGLSQKDVATLLGIATSTYSSWETEPHRIKIKNAKELAVIFGESLDVLFLN
ncbi:helix-turn-helix domain-containing protein [Turicibacter sanguinis]|uniref:helix-turn-helix transcriptional regulator n=1 Tax=Turicibacter sanguinis TaxID=154288 RepID=UPI0012BBFA3B|nr:helix-turn-helix transcriptional regulator [Turicibacter sanguinis]MDB8552616.1 helix-turn-helix transcriptional regulator [Turicibacter sanguinis]MTN80709.1 helix-turn-helix domain-containing protein [Turicibacter sanguinis]MTN85225.1 helix-turn-helix domain-containing protein [Turicibacter sanguinis]MTN88046.1 helix-turn-helix domain-containing protein [Turicibacter sanguinis]MTN90900.1 helix-turn-helix domain-containing protein [Turicibacter sanguinis]